jgi:hypothetical protein
MVHSVQYILTHFHLYHLESSFPVVQYGISLTDSRWLDGVGVKVDSCAPN